MFDRLKKAFAQGEAPSSQPAAANEVSQWAGVHGFSYSALGAGNGFSVEGTAAGKPFKLERGASTRDYMHGDELRARAEMKLNDDVSVVIINRPLKDALEKRAYEMYTDTLQTTADPNLPEEMRWLAMYPEAGWDGTAPEFWKRYAVLSEKRDQALAWVDPHLANLLITWPEPAPNEQVPFILMLLRGKAWLRMQYTPADMPTLNHAMQIFTYACESAASRLTADILL